MRGHRDDLCWFGQHGIGRVFRCFGAGCACCLVGCAQQDQLFGRRNRDGDADLHGWQRHRSGAQLSVAAQRCRDFRGHGIDLHDSFSGCGNQYTQLLCHGDYIGWRQHCDQYDGNRSDGHHSAGYDQRRARQHGVRNRRDSDRDPCLQQGWIDQRRGAVQVDAIRRDPGAEALACA